MTAAPLAYLCLAAFLAGVVCLGESVQAAEKLYDRPVVLRYLQMASTALLAPLALPFFPPSQCKNAASLLRALLWPSAAVCAVLTFAGGLINQVALTGTSVGVSTSLTRTKPIFIYVLSVAFRLLDFSPYALLATGLCVAGIALLICAGTSGHSTADVKQTWWGAVLTVIAAFLWAACDVYMQHRVVPRFVRSPSVVVQMFFFQALTGAWDLVAFWPAIPISAAVQTEAALDWPPASALPIIGAACASLMLTNVSVGVGIACSSALFMGMGSLLAVPVAFTADYFLHGNVPGLWDVCGAVLVVAAFVVMTMCGMQESNERAGARRARVAAGGKVSRSAMATAALEEPLRAENFADSSRSCASDRESD